MRKWSCQLCLQADEESRQVKMKRKKFSRVQTRIPNRYGILTVMSAVSRIWMFSGNGLDL